MKYLALFVFALTMVGAVAVPTTQAVAGPRCGWHRHWVPGRYVWNHHHRRWIPGHCV